MANVQKENGFTPIAHEILEAMAQIKLSPTQYRLIFIIWRYTYGFQRKEHDLSLSFLSKATGCDKRQIQRELKTLEEKNIIKQNIKDGSYRKISFNKNYETWTSIGKTTVGEITIGQTDNGETINTTVGETVNATIGETVNQDIKPIDNSKEIQAQEVFDYYISKNIIRHQKFDSEMKRKTKAQIKKWGIEEIKTAIHNYSIVFHSNDYWFKTKYSLLDILRDKDIRQFGSEADPLFNFAKDKNKARKEKEVEEYKSDSIKAPSSIFKM